MSSSWTICAFFGKSCLVFGLPSIHTCKDFCFGINMKIIAISNTVFSLTNVFLIYFITNDVLLEPLKCSDSFYLDFPLQVWRLSESTPCFFSDKPQYITRDKLHYWKSINSRRHIDVTTKSRCTLE